MSIEKSALQWLADISDGDARIALTNLQLILQHNSESNTLITVDDIKEGMKKSHMLYDRKGEEHYNIISALHKSIRGSDVNAAVYWLTRMIVSGEDPLFIARRLVRAASEDIGIYIKKLNRLLFLNNKLHILNEPLSVIKARILL